MKNVLCKKNFKDGIFEYKEGKWYSCGGIWIFCINGEPRMLRISNDFVVLSFSLEENDTYHRYFGDYFYSEKEVRKMKLQNAVSNQLDYEK